MAKKTKKAKPVAEIEEIEDEELELEELDDDVEEEEAPKAKKAKKAKKYEVTFGATDLAAYITEQTNKVIDSRGLRILLRKMAKDGRLNREIIPGNRARYNWSGPNDPEVKLILKAVKSGEVEEGKKEALDKLKSKKAAEHAAKPAKKKAKKAAAPVEDDEDEEFEDDDE